MMTQARQWLPLLALVAVALGAAVVLRPSQAAECAPGFMPAAQAHAGPFAAACVQRRGP